MEVMEYHYDCYKTPGKTSASTAVRRLALWAERYQKAYALFTFITRSARFNEKRSGDLSLLSPENFGDSAIFPSEKISASLIEILSSRSHKTPAGQCPSYPHWGRMNAFATAVRSGPSALRGPIDSSFAIFINALHIKQPYPRFR